MSTTKQNHDLNGVPSPAAVDALSQTEAAASEAENEPPDQRSLRRRVFNLAAPVIGENFLDTLLGIVDTILVAKLGAVAIAGVGSAIQVLFFVISALSALSVGSAVLVAQAYGAKNYERAGRLAQQSLIWSVILSLPLAISGLFLARPLINLFGLETEVTEIGVAYLQVTMGTSVVMTLLLIGGGVLRGADDSRTPMFVKVIANIVNVFLSIGLIFGYAGLPALGAVGSAWATFVARSLAVALLVIVLWRGRNGVTIRVNRSWWPNWSVARQVLQIGVPAALEQVLISMAFFILTILVAGLGTATMAAHRIVMNAMSLSFLPGIGFGLAATSLVGQSIGARRPREGGASGGIATRWALLWMSGMGLLMFIFAPQVMLVFSQEPDVVAVGTAGLRAISLTQPFWAIFFVQSGALRGTGNTQFPLRVNATGIWIAVGLAYLFINTVRGGLGAVWSAFIFVAPITATLVTWRFRRAIADVRDSTNQQTAA